LRLPRHWYPYEALDHGSEEWQSICAVVCGLLQQLGFLLAEDEAPASQLAYILEKGWGVGNYEDRPQRQNEVLSRHVSTDRRRGRLCAIAERARDQAHVYAQP
jgi:hypothetical protein